jgi:hypothetical protein
MKNRVMEWRDLPVFFQGVGQRRQFFFWSCVGVESGLSTVHFPLGQWTINFPCKLWGHFPCKLLRGVKSNSSQVPDMFPEEFTIGPHFYVWQMLGQRGRALYFKIEPSILRSLHRFICFSDGPIKLAYCTQKKKNLGGTSST